VGLLQGDTILDTLFPAGGDVSYTWEAPAQSGIYPFTLIAEGIPSEVIYINVEVPANPSTDQKEIKAKSNNKVKIFPNPVKDHLNIIIPDHQSHQLIKIYDWMGKIEMTKKCTNFNTKINTSSLKSGIYIIKTGGFSGKFIKH
ncbi:MAG: T9SS type A sorting domain-containing protein, partial [Bacteroidota bacterium]